MISDNCSLSHLCEILFLNHALQLSECVFQIESLALYLHFFPLDSYSTELTSLGESNNPNTTQLWGLLPQLTTEG